MAFGLVALLVASSGVAFAGPATDLAAADAHVQAATSALDRGSLDEARLEFERFGAAWPPIEDSVKAADPVAYQTIEQATRDARVAFAAEPVDATVVDGALDRLHAADEAFIVAQGGSTAATATPAATDPERVRALLARLGAARAALAGNDAAAALAALKTFEADWLPAEGFVRARSQVAYTETENDMAQAEALLRSQPARTAEADGVLTRMHDRLAPIAQTGTTYGIFDAFTIMLREGLEALLVISALIAFLRKSHNGHRQGWVWAGAGVGLSCSIVLALALQQGFTRAESALGTEMIEAVVGLTAAAMLFYVSYWLHAKARLGAWQSFIRDKSTAALAGGNMTSLAAIAGLAVFREGAESAVFYVGIAPSIAFGDLVLGLALGLASLAVIGLGLLVVGVRLPLRPFFLVSSALIYYLGFKFLGAGLHALQVAGVLPATPAPLPSSDVFGLYPTWETAIPQLALVAIALAVVWLSVRRGTLGGRTPSASASV